MTTTTEIRVNERGDETHESWVLIRANRVSSMGFGPKGVEGARLFDSEIAHQHYIIVEVSRCSRRRSLNHDHLFAEQKLLGLAMSQAQWGAFVSSFGDGSGVPATLEWLTGVGHVPTAPPELRFEESRAEVHEAGEKALQTVQESYERLAEAFETGGKKAQREALRDLGIRLQNAPKSMEFAATSLKRFVEDTVTKARADIEAMALAASKRAALAQSTQSALPLLESGDKDG